MLRDIPDTELASPYGRCFCAVFNSACEGWGPPVTESAGRGKVPIVADNSSLRQAGGEAALSSPAPRQSDGAISRHGAARS